MKRCSKWKIIFPVLILIFTWLPAIIYAQCPDAGFDPGCDPVTCTRADGSYCPIDSNLYILLAIGVLYGVKKVRNARKEKPVESLEV